MKITSQALASVTEMYSAASSQLTETNATADVVSGNAGGRVGMLGIGKRYVSFYFISFLFSVSYAGWFKSDH